LVVQKKAVSLQSVSPGFGGEAKEFRASVAGEEIFEGNETTKCSIRKRLVRS
jgi:hypothetical protein